MSTSQLKSVGTEVSTGIYLTLWISLCFIAPSLLGFVAEIILYDIILYYIILYYIILYYIILYYIILYYIILYYIILYYIILYYNIQGAFLKWGLWGVSGEPAEQQRLRLGRPAPRADPRGAAGGCGQDPTAGTGPGWFWVFKMG